jgi:hypothetical protein
VREAMPQRCVQHTSINVLAALTGAIRNNIRNNASHQTTTVLLAHRSSRVALVN